MRPLAKIGLGALAVGTIAAIVVVATRKVASGSGSGDDEGGDEMPGTGKFENADKVIAVGEATDPKVAPLLAEIRAKWDAAGIDPQIITPEQFYVMTKATHADGPDEDDKPSAIMAIASRATWDRTAQFVATALQPVVRDIIRRGVKRSQIRYGGFREGYGSDGKGKGSYNTVVGGAKASRHVDGDGADIIPTGGKGTGHIIKLAIARFRLDHPKLGIGFGAYANNGHVDIGGDRDWSGDSVPGEAEKYMALAKKEAAVS